MRTFFQKNIGIRWRLGLVVLTIPMAVAGAVLIWQDYQSRRDAIITQVNLKSSEINAQLEDVVHTVQGTSGTFAESWVHQHTPLSHTEPVEQEAMSSYLAEFVENRPHFSGAYVTDTSGVVLVSSQPSGAGPVGPDSLYLQARSDGKFTVSDVVVPSAEEEPPFALFVQPLKWRLDIPQQFLVLRTELSTISAALDMSVGFPTTAKSGIFDSQGRILAGTGYEKPHPGLAAGRDISGSAVWAQAKTLPTQEWFRARPRQRRAHYLLWLSGYHTMGDHRCLRPVRAVWPSVGPPMDFRRGSGCDIGSGNVDRRDAYSP